MATNQEDNNIYTVAGGGPTGPTYVPQNTFYPNTSINLPSQYTSALGPAVGTSGTGGRGGSAFFSSLPSTSSNVSGITSINGGQTYNTQYDPRGYNAGGLTPEQQQAASYADLLAQRNNINDQYSYVTGGPNLALIRQLGQQNKALLQQYKSNRADAESMYGQLSQDVESMGADVQAGYQGAIDASGQRAQDYVGTLSAEQKAQEDRRAKALAELGIAPEGTLADYQSTKELNRVMGDVLAQNIDWTGLLGSQKGSAAESTQNLKTSVGENLRQTVLGMKAAKQAATNNILSQIAAEKAKTGTRQLTDIGQMWMDKNTAALQGIINPPAPEVNKYQAQLETQIQGFEGIKNPAGAPSAHKDGPMGWYQDMYQRAVDAYSQSKMGVGKPVDATIALFVKTFFGSPANLTTVQPGYMGMGATGPSF